MMWHNALLSGVSGKNFPDLKKFMRSADKNQVHGIDENAIIERLMAHSKKYKEKNGTDSKTSG